MRTIDRLRFSRAADRIVSALDRLPHGSIDSDLAMSIARGIPRFGVRVADREPDFASRAISLAMAAGRLRLAKVDGELRIMRGRVA